MTAATAPALSVQAIPKRELSREEWLAVRRQGVGSSDAAAVVGANPYCTPYDLWLEKTGQAPEPDFSEKAKEAMQLGTELEEFVAREFARRTGRKVRRDNFVRVHPEHPFMLANLDRQIVAEDGGEPEILECKIAGAHAVFGEEWGDGPDEIPERYIIQVQHQMVVTGRKRAFLAALLASTSFRIYEIPFDEEIGSMLIAAESDFWAHVQSRELPTITSAQDARRAYPSSNGKSIEATAEVMQAVCDLRLAKADEKALKGRIESLQGKICAFIGDNEILTRFGDKVASWKSSERAGYTVAPTTTRILLLAKDKSTGEAA